MEKRVAFVYGTRPEYIKIAPVVDMMEHSTWAAPFVISTGQASDIGQAGFEAFKMTPDVNLNIMVKGQTLAYIVAASLPAVLGELNRHSEIVGVVVQGDAHSAFVGALAAYYSKLPIAHIEAGLRTYDRYSPFPEEMNRQLIGQLANLHFCPTQLAFDRLEREMGFSVDNKLFVTGNTEIDGALAFRNQIEERKVYELDGRPLILVTAHRRESHGRTLIGIFNAIYNLANKFPEYQWLLPLHPNPNVQDAARSSHITDNGSLVHLCPPLDYLDMLACVNRAILVLTDSGGVQENASAYHTPVVVLRDWTERKEGIISGCAIMPGTDSIEIEIQTTRLLIEPGKLEAMAEVECPYGDGTAASQINDILEEEWGDANE